MGVRVRGHIGLLFLLALSPAARAQAGPAGQASGGYGSPATSGPMDIATDSPASLEKLARLLVPGPASEGLYMKLWGWGSYLNVSRAEQRSNGDGQLSLDITKSFGGRVAVSLEMSLMAANDHFRGDLEQAYASALLSAGGETVITGGKFHASIGAEGRDPWDRFGGTTSLLFNAEPQDFVGIELTQRMGETGLVLKPFLVTNFDGTWNVDGGPSGGLIVQYRPCTALTLQLTNWVGPGFGPEDDDDGDEEEGDEYGGAAAIENWMGPELQGEQAGILYFVDGKAMWTPQNDVTIAAEALLGTTPAENAGWQGCLVEGNFDLTDQWRLFGRWSFLNDSAGLITGVSQRRNELSAGVGYVINQYFEVRAEYRHDFSDVLGDTDSVSFHLIAGF